MSVNQANQTLQHRLVDEIAHLKREILALKTRQLFGADNLPPAIGTELTASITLPAMTAGGFDISLTRASGLPFVGAEPPAVTVYVITDNDPDYILPYGSTAASLVSLVNVSHHGMHWTMWKDFDTTDEVNGHKSYTLNIWNGHSSTSYTFYIHAQWVYPYTAT